MYDPQTLNRYTFERNNPYKYTDPTGHFAISIGLGGSVGFISGASGSVGLAQSISGSDGYEYGGYASYGAGLTTPSLEAHIDFGIHPGAKNLRDFEGTDTDFDVDVGEAIGFGFGISTPYSIDENGKRVYDKKKTSLTLSLSPGTELNPPILPASASLMDSSSKSRTFMQLSLSGVTLNPGGNKQLSADWKEIRKGVFRITYSETKDGKTTQVTRVFQGLKPPVTKTSSTTRGEKK